MFDFGNANEGQRLAIETVDGPVLITAGPGTGKTYTLVQRAIYLIKEVLFKQESHHQQIHYHIDERGQIWLNLDYTATYPGGKFMSEEILGELTFN